jgi:hypothetical protein
MYLWISCDFKSLLLVPLSLKEAGNLIHLVLRDILEHLGSSFGLIPEDECLVLKHSEGQSEGNYIDILVGKVDPSIAGQIAKEIHGLVKVGDGIGLITHKVVETVGRVGVDKAVTNPLSGANGLVDGSNKLHCGLNTILISLTIVHTLDVGLARVAKDVKGILASERHQLSRLRPMNL